MIHSFPMRGFIAITRHLLYCDFLKMAAKNFGRRYLLYYAQDHPGFRIPELQSVIETANANISYDILENGYEENRPFLVVNATDEEEVLKISQRSILLRYSVELWASGFTLQDILGQKERVSAFTRSFFKDENSTFKIDVEAFGKKLSIDAKKQWINSIGEVLDIPGKVKLQNPTHTLCLILDFHSKDDAAKTCNCIYFGRVVANGQRDLLHNLSLKSRYFIGNTSMDPQLAFLMANQGKVKKGSFVYDPFVGTGSILTCCAKFGAYTSGSDIDRTIIYGRGKSSRAGNRSWRARDEIIRTNYKQYSLLDRYVDIIVADVTRTPFRVPEIFDAIVTDPPYGIREGGRKLNAKESVGSEISHEEKDCMLPSSSLHQLSDIILDLIHFAAMYLRIGGRLVFWLPVYAPSYNDELIPKHPCFGLIANCEQKLTSKISRRLITMEKISSIQQIPMDSWMQTNEQWRQTHNQFRSNYFKGTT